MQPKRILVALAGTSADPDIIRLVASIAKPAKAQVIGIHVIEVRWNLPLDAVMEQELDRGEELLESSKKVADQAGLMLETELLQARDAAAAIVDTAVERADAVLALTEGDNRNLMAAQIAQKIFGVKRVIAKVNDPVRAQTYRKMGIDTFSRTTILGTLLHAMLQDDREVGEVLIRKSLAHEEELAHEPVKAR